MPRNESEIVKLFNKKSGLMFVVKDLMNPGEPSKNKMLFTIAQCKKQGEEYKKIREVDFFMDIIDIKTLYTLLLHDRLSSWNISKVSGAKTRYITISKMNGSDNSKDPFYSFKIDSVDEDRISLNYYISFIDTVHFLTAVIDTIQKNELQHTIQMILGNKCND